jgi:hypothetical protein
MATKRGKKDQYRLRLVLQTGAHRSEQKRRSRADHAQSKNSFTADHSRCAIEERSGRGPTVVNIKPNDATRPITIASSSVFPN